MKVVYVMQFHLAESLQREVQDGFIGSGRGFTTVHGCGSASGVHLPPFVVYKGKPPL